MQFMKSFHLQQYAEEASGSDLSLLTEYYGYVSFDLSFVDST